MRRVGPAPKATLNAVGAPPVGAGRLAAVADAHDRRLVPVGLALSLLALAWSISSYAATSSYEMINSALFACWVTAWLAAITIGIRTLGVADVVRVWLVGYFLVPLAVWVIGQGTGWALGVDSGAQRAVLVPVLEETAKLAPVALFLRPLRRRWTWPGLSDLAILGFTSGAAFAFREDAIRVRLAADGFDDGPWSWLFPTSVHIEERLVLGHGLWTMTAAIGLGIAATYRRAWAWAIGVALLSVAVLDHAAANTRGDAADRWAAFLANGTLPAAVAFLALIGAVAHDGLVLRSVRRLDDRYRLEPLVGDDPLRRLRRRRLLNGGHLHSHRTRRLGRTLGDRSSLLVRLDRL
ncbi:MAG: PrsW family glutamic-type intramembrane protease [Actinomycetota bacterium]